jgi:fructosamine-3-kinase
MNHSNNKENWSFIADCISSALNKTFVADDLKAVSGGDIHQSYRVNDSKNNLTLFVKTNHRKYYHLFQSESESLDSIQQSNAIKTPRVITHNCDDSISFLALEFLNFGNKNNDFQLGQQLARMHKHTENTFGFTDNNYIGNTPQLNRQYSSWSEFWLRCRLQPQLELAYRQGYQSSLKKSEQALFKACKEQLQHQPQASLLHGDLWGGNIGFLKDGTPVIFDPACYYGDRETDIAMTELFGGFSTDFYQGYNESWPLEPGYKKRKSIYQLYHQLNHLNLFGSGYLGTCKQSMTNIIKNAELI